MCGESTRENGTLFSDKDENRSSSNDMHTHIIFFELNARSPPNAHYSSLLFSEDSLLFSEDSLQLTTDSLQTHYKLTTSSLQSHYSLTTYNKQHVNRNAAPLQNILASGITILKDCCTYIINIQYGGRWYNMMIT